MPAIPTGPLERQDRLQVAQFFGENLTGTVSLDLWTTHDAASGLVRTDRDVCTKCADVTALVRQLATLHPRLTVTPYDLNRHADRASQARIEFVPTTVIRGHGRSIQLVGLCGGGLFPVLLDLIAYASNGLTPVQEPTRLALQALPETVTLEAMVEPYDSYSAQLARLVGAFGLEARQVRARLIEMGEFPVLAGRRALTEVPALTINGRRFNGTWLEDELAEQIARVLAGNAEPVVRDQVRTTPYLSEEAALAVAQRQSEAQAEAHRLAPDPSGAPATGGGLYVPGRD